METAQHSFSNWGTWQIADFFFDSIHIRIWWEKKWQRFLWEIMIKFKKKINQYFENSEILKVTHTHKGMCWKMTAMHTWIALVLRCISNMPWIWMRYCAHNFQLVQTISHWLCYIMATSFAHTYFAVYRYREQWSINIYQMISNTIDWGVTNTST